jgi:hypothetical protein
MTNEARAGNALASLRRFALPPAAVERCDLCAAVLPPDHAHLVEVASRRLRCACTACAVLFSDPAAARYRRVPGRLRRLTDLRLTDTQWLGLDLPINLAFFVYRSAADRVVALCPSPGGPTESLPPPEAWEDLAADNPVLRELEPDVEALLVNRLGAEPVYYRTGIDRCYELVGLVRTHWRGLSGGTAVWEEIDRFFAALRDRAGPPGGAGHA